MFRICGVLRNLKKRDGDSGIGRDSLRSAFWPHWQIASKRLRPQEVEAIFLGARGVKRGQVSIWQMSSKNRKRPHIRFQIAHKTKEKPTKANNSPPKKHPKNQQSPPKKPQKTSLSFPSEPPTDRNALLPNTAAAGKRRKRPKKGRRRPGRCRCLRNGDEVTGPGGAGRLGRRKDRGGWGGAKPKESGLVK